MSDCETCPVEKDCHYPYKPTDCVGQRKFRSAPTGLKPNPRPHFHQCGRVRDGWLDNYGCGYLWQHQRNPNLHIADDHKCPNCSKGPWYYELSIEEVENAKTKESAA